MSFIWKSGSRRRQRRKSRSRPRMQPLMRRGSIIPPRSAFPRCVRGSPDTTAILTAVRSSRADRGHDRLVRRFHSGVSVDVRAGRSGCGHRAGLSAVSAYPDRARLRAGADRDLERHAPCADRRGVAGRASQDAAERRVGRQPRQSDRNNDVARGAGRPDRMPRKAPASASFPTRSITASITRFRR